MKNPKEILEIFDCPKHLPVYFSQAVYEFYMLSLEEHIDKEEINFYLEIFKSKLNELDIHFPTKILDYAIKLAGSSGELEYEEMHKLFSLCNEIYAMEELGFELDDNQKRTYIITLKERFKKEPKKSFLVAEDKSQDWNRELWWFKLNLQNGK